MIAGFRLNISCSCASMIPLASAHEYRYTGEELEFRIGYVLPIDAERVVFSLLRRPRVLPRPHRRR